MGSPLHCIVPKLLYLGNQVVANDLALLGQLNITHVLSVWDDQLANKSNSIAYMTVWARDEPSQDVLSQLPDGLDFIDKAISSGQAVLVHCHKGYTQSPALVIAYLMKKWRKPYEDIRKYVHRIVRQIQPNLGLAQQLRFYEDMGFTLDANNQLFRRYLMDSILGSDISPDKKWSNNLSVYFARLDTSEKMTTNLDLGADYLCSECDFKLFNEIHVIKAIDLTAEDLLSCDYIYIEPQKWMTELFEIQDCHKTMGIIEMSVKCPQCHQHLVHYKPMFRPLECIITCLMHKTSLQYNRFRIDIKDIKRKPLILSMSSLNEL